MIFYQGLANLLLGRRDAAVERFESLVRYGEQQFDQPVSIDFFAVSLPDFLVFEADLVTNHQLHCRFMRALGLIGLDRFREAESEFQQILAFDANHLGAVLHMPLCQARDWESMITGGPHFSAGSPRHLSPATSSK